MAKSRQFQTDNTTRLQLLLWARKVASKTPWLAAYLLRQARQITGLINRWLAGLRPSKQLVASTITGAALTVATAVPASAGTITVNSTTDDGVGCTLREAIIAANTDNAAYADCTITGVAGDDTLDLTTLAGTITLTSDLPTITGTVQINGPGSGILTVNGANNRVIYSDTNGSNIGVDGLTITNAGGFAAVGSYAYSDVTVTNSTITGAGCGVVAFYGTAVISNSTVTGLGCEGVQAINATVTNSTVTGNYTGVVARDHITVTNSSATGTLYDGLYSVNGNIIVNNNSTITGGRDGILTEFYYYGAGGGVTVNDSTITGGRDGINSNLDVTVTNSHVTGNAYEGVFSATGNAIVTSSVITGTEDGVQGQINAIVEDSIVTATNDDGVDANVGYAKVSNSIIRGGESGVDSDGGFVSVISSTITGISEHGIDATTYATVISSTVTGSTLDGIRAGTNVTASYSTIVGAQDGVAATSNITLDQSTVSGSGRHGVHSLANQTVTINHSTIFNNTGYGIRNALGTTQLHNTIVASNGGLGTTKDINGTLNAASSYNLIGNGDSSGLTNGVNGNLLGTTGSLINAMLGVLQNNGGNTLTHLPSPGSPAINTGNPAFIAPPTQDQRGTGFDRVFDSRLDIGAVEATETSLNLYLPIIVRAASSDLN